MSVELNIVDLIENQPITKLTGTYNVKLLNKIQEIFTSEEQQLFVASFYCYLNCDAYKDFVVDLDKAWIWLGFKQKIDAKRAVERYFTLNCDYRITDIINVDNTFALDCPKANNRGGHNIKKIMLTIKCFKSLCLKAQTKKAAEIHEYYMKLEETMYVLLEEETTELKQKLIDSATTLQATTAALQRSPEISNHNTLLRKFGAIQGALIYIIRIQQHENGSYIIKIGESRKGLRGRLAEFKTKYGPHVIILDCFTVHNSVGLEKYLHGHPEIYREKVTTLEGHEKENELFLIGRQLTYARVQEIIEVALPQFNNIAAEYEKLKQEVEELRIRPLHGGSMNVTLLQELLRTNQEILQSNRQLQEQIRRLELSQQELMTRVNATQVRTVTPATGLPDPHLGPRVQQIHPETLQLLHVYDSITECMREDPTRKRPSLNKAARENTVYRGFRWQLVDRTIDATTLIAPAATRPTQLQKNGYIAKINADQTAIITVYLDRKTAAQQNQCGSIGSLDWAVKHHTIKNGHYYMLYEECDSTLRIAFEAQYGHIILYQDGVGEYDNDRLIAEYTSRNDCTTRTGMSQKLLAKVLDQRIPYKEHFYRTRGSKKMVP